MKQQTIVFKISDNLKDKVIEFYKDRALEKHPPYSVFQVKDYDCVITLYESGKLMFQGIGADIEASYWMEEERILNKRDLQSELKSEQEKKDKKAEELNDDRFKNISTIGSFVDIKKKSFLYELGVRDSKKITDEKIMSIAPTLIKEFPHVTYILTPSDYNRLGITNMNKVKAILHNKVLYALKEKNYNYDKIVVDQFCYPVKYYEHIKATPNKVTNITFTTHAEDKCLSVAVSSIISRYIFIKEMEKLTKEMNMNIPKGAGTNVDEVGVKIVKQYGINKLNELAKLNFKNTEKIKEFLQI